MATPTDVNLNIDHQLRMLAADIADMRTLLQTWEVASVSERLTWESEWPAVTALLDVLCRRYQAGTLTFDQGRCLETLLSQAGSMAPMLKRHGFAIPSCG